MQDDQGPNDPPEKSLLSDEDKSVVRSKTFVLGSRDSDDLMSL